MHSVTVIHHYMSWHYSKGVTDFFRVWGTLLWFVAHFFSFSLILRTLFSPWKRMEERGKGIQGFFEALIVNTFVRLTGFIIRLITFAFGLVIFSLLFIFGIVGFILWIAFPLAAILALIIGITILVS